MLKKGFNLTELIEGYLFSPSPLGILLAFLLLPFSLIYCSVSAISVLLQKKIAFPVPIISVGNLTIGGSGKSPFIAELSKRYDDCAIILRGYGRKSKGLAIVNIDGNLQCGVEQSGDEAMMLASLAPKSLIIVSEDRILGIQKAIELGAKIVFLDDGYRHGIEKYDILLRAQDEPKLPFCLPSGAYRLPRFFYKKSHLTLREGVDFKRIVMPPEEPRKYLFVSAISRAQRVLRYLEKLDIRGTYILKDHSFFDEDSIKNRMRVYGAERALTTLKDKVKMENFSFDVDVIALKIEINEKVFEGIEQYIAQFHGINIV